MRCTQVFSVSGTLTNSMALTSFRGGGDALNFDAVEPRADSNAAINPQTDNSAVSSQPEPRTDSTIAATQPEPQTDNRHPPPPAAAPSRACWEKPELHAHHLRHRQGCRD